MIFPPFSMLWFGHITTHWADTLRTKSVNVVNNEGIPKSIERDASNNQTFHARENHHVSSVVLLSVVAPLAITEGSVSPQELNALYALYNATNGVDWQWETDSDSGPKWDFTTVPFAPTPCENGYVWQGLVCTCPHEEYCVITAIYLDEYGLDGPLPAAIGNLTSLTILSLSGNALTGSIPSLDSLNQLQDLYLDSNALTGSIPSLDNLSQLQDLYLNSNALTGSIPSLDSLSQLQDLLLNTNTLTGSIPSLDSLNQLMDLFLDSNALTGSIPSLDSLNQLLSLYLSNNVLTGSIPSLDSLNNLQLLFFDKNALTGSIPSLNKLIGLQTFFVSNNLLAGKLDSIVSPQVQLRLNTLQLSSNQFSGTIPALIFELPALETFAIVSNCMRGPLPLLSICNSSSLRSLLLDGLHTASSCRTSLFNHLIPRLYLLDSESANLADQLDPCLFTVPTLNTLHMSGNGLTGTIPDISQQQEKNKTSIIDLVLSYNELTGTIPLFLQEQQYWSTLDLSYNRLNGVLSSQFTSVFENHNRSSISLNLNRISGPIPQSLNKAANISVLTGNLYSCSIDGSNLPIHDEERDHYSCGSNAFNVPYYFWLTIFGCVVVLLLVASVSRMSMRRITTKMGKNGGVAETTSQHTNTLLSWFNKINIALCTAPVLVEERMDAVHAKPGHPSQSTKVSYESQRSSYIHTRRLEQLSDGMRRFAGRCWLYISIVLVPVYIICGLFSSTYTYRYAWTVSTSFLSGSTTAGILLCTLTLYIWFLAFQYDTLAFSISAASVAATRIVASVHCVSDGVAKSLSIRHQIVYALPWLAVILINVLIVGLSNVGFVWVSVYHGSQLNLFAVQVALAVVKYVWNSKLLRVTIHWFVSLVSDLSVAHIADGAVSLELYLAVFNNVVIPCFVTAVVDPDCFYSSLVPPNKVAATFKYPSSTIRCEIMNEATYCFQFPMVSSTSFAPPFSYSYQCSASFTTHYATAFLYVCIVIGVAVPSWEFFLMYMHSTQLNDKQRAPPFSTTTTTTLRMTNDTISPLALSQVDKEETIITKLEEAVDSSIVYVGTMRVPESHANKWQLRLLSSDIVPLLLKPVPLTPINHNDSSSGSISGKAPNLALIFDTTQYLTTVLILFALLFTFGTVFPPLGFAIVVTLVVYTYFTQFKLARFITLSKQTGLLSQIEQVDKECSTFVLPSKQGGWVLATIACWFYAIILFDTLGDAVGYKGALWVLFVMTLLPVVLYFGDRVLLGCFARHDSTQQPQQQDEKEQSIVTETASGENGALEMGHLTPYAHAYIENI